MGGYIPEAIISLKENIRYVLTFIVFLSLSFLGVIITDSLIYSVSMQAEKELKSRGNNIISIELYHEEKKDSIAKVLDDFYAKLSYSQHSFLNGGNSPYSDEAISVMAIDKAGINLIMGDEFDSSLFEGNVAIYNNNSQDISDKPRMIFFNGVPFHIIGIKKKYKAEFLDSLGLSLNNSNEKYYIPLDTLFRFNLDNKIDNVQIIFDKDVTQEMSIAVKDELDKNNIDKYMIATSFDARMIVERVLNRFSLLTNSIYLLLTTTAIISCVIVCKRNFQSRSTEFALKIIHGISHKDIQIVVVIETIFTVIISLLLSIVISILAIISLSSMLHITVKIRWLMILMSLSTVLISCFIANLFYGNKTFKMNPVDLIKARTK